MPLLRVGIVLYQNPPDELRRLATSLMRSVLPPGLRVEAQLLDNSADDRLDRLVREVLPEARYRWTGQNRGFGATHNLGMREAFGGGADAYLCLNPDARLHPDCLASLWSTAAAPRTGLVDARTFPEEHPKPYDPVTGDTPWCTGTALLVTRAAFDAAGGFDEALFLYGEDVDLSWRVRAAGLRTRTAASALVVHWVEYRPLERERQLRVLRSAAYLGRKWGAASFARSHERLFRALAGRTLEHPHLEAMPRGTRSVADFRHGVRFARSRW